MTSLRMSATAERAIVVADDRVRARRIGDLLTGAGQLVSVAPSGAAALADLEGSSAGLVVVDLELAGADGLGLCRLLREFGRAQVIAVAPAGDGRAPAALDAGADDFVVWPIDEAVFAARVRVALRRAAAQAVPPGGAVLVCGDVQLDVDAHLMLLDDHRVELQPRQFALLVTLIRNAGRLVSYATLTRAVWDEAPDGGDVERLRSAISVLRRNLGHGPRRPVIQTAPTLGYRLVVPG